MTTNPTTPPPARPAALAEARLEPRWVIRTAWVAHRALVSVTRGRFGYRPATAEQWGMLRLHTVGRRSGQERLAILGYIEDGHDLVTLAMNGWGEGEPAWWLNLQAQPDAVVELAGGPRLVRARAATADERPRLWARWDTRGNLDAYAARRPGETAIVILEPRTASGS